MGAAFFENLFDQGGGGGLFVRVCDANNAHIKTELEKKVHLSLERGGELEERVGLRDGGVDDHEVGVAEVSLVVTAEMQRDGEPFEFLHRLAEVAFGFRIHHSNLHPPPN